MKSIFRDIVNIGPQCIERFIDSGNAPEIRALEIELAGCSNLAGNYVVGRVNPPNHTLFFSLSGRGQFRTPSGQYTLSTGGLIILPAHQSFEVTIDSEKWDIVWLNLSNSTLWSHLKSSEATCMEGVELVGLHHAMELLYSETNALHRQAVLPIIKHYLHRITTPEPPSHVSRLAMLFSNVEKQLQFGWSVDALSERVHYSPPHLHRLCLAEYGRSPMQYVIYLRMQRAKNLLISTQWPIAYIANYVGYSNVFTFSKRFKKSEGISPREFRETINETEG